MWSKSTPTTDTCSKEVLFSCNDALSPVAWLLVPHGRVHCGNVNRAPIGNRMTRTDCTNSLVKHGFETLLREGGTLQVFDSANIFGHCHALRVLNWRHAPKRQTRRIIHQQSTHDMSENAMSPFPQLFNGTRVFAKIQFRPDEHDGCRGGMMRDLWMPLRDTVQI